MGPAGHFAVGLAAKPLAPKVPLGILLLATEILDILATAFASAGIELTTKTPGIPWSHGLFMSVVWAFLAVLLTARFYRDFRASLIVGLLVLSHWVLDFISHPIPFSSFSFCTWQWTYGHPMPPDLPLLLKVGLGLYNSISAVQATALELVMFLLGTIVYVTYKRGKKKE